MEEEVLRVLEAQQKGITYSEVFSLLNSNKTDLSKLQETLDVLVERGKVHRTKHSKYILTQKCSTLVNGYLKVNKKGNGFILMDNQVDIFVSKHNLNGAIDGDFVEADISYGEGEGIITQILKRDINSMVGEIIKINGRLEFKPDNEKKLVKIKLTEESLENCVEGHKVVVTPVKEIGKNIYIGEVEKILGHKNDPGTDIVAIAAQYGIYNEFSEEAMEEANSLPTKVLEKDLEGRRDLRDEQIFTIDGADTKDIDDAISIKKYDDYYELGVHIADVSYYVKEGTELRKDALSKGNSSYLADTVFPMLPHILSNGICSLNENVDRLAISCVMKINKNGKIFDYDIFPSVINSKKKMVYDDVNKILINNEIPEGYEQFAQDLKDMHEVAKILRKAKIARGYNDFDLDEGKIIQDEEGKAIDVVLRHQLEGEKLIEDFMIAANETVASHIYHMGLPFIYRVHGDPKQLKVENFMKLLKMLGIKIDVNVTEITPKTIQNILFSLENNPKFKILSGLLLRSMKKAEYSPDNIGHFGLASKIYTHFTSPIRRYSDLVVHTLLRKYLFNGEMDLNTYESYENELPVICKSISDSEVDSIEAEREVFDMKAAEYMQDHIGEEHTGVITGITKYGFYVELPNLVEGLVLVKNLDGHYEADQDLLSMYCPGHRTYRLGDKVNIIVSAANKEAHTIDFEVSYVRKQQEAREESNQNNEGKYKGKYRHGYKK